MKRYLLHVILLNHKALKNCLMCVMVLRLKIIYIFQVSCSVLGVGELLGTLSKVLRSMTLAEIAGSRSVKWTPGGAMLEFAVLEVSVWRTVIFKSWKCLKDWDYFFFHKAKFSITVIRSALFSKFMEKSQNKEVLI